MIFTYFFAFQSKSQLSPITKIKKTAFHFVLRPTFINFANSIVGKQNEG